MIDSLLHRLPERAADRVATALPGATRSRVQRELAKRRLDDYLSSRLRHFYKPSDPGPVGPENLVAGTQVMTEDDLGRQATPDHYFTTGYRQVLHWLQRAEQAGFNIRTAGTVLELGSGSGRLIRHFRPIMGMRLIGSDLLQSNVDWCSANLPGIEFHRNELDPPLKFLADGEVDYAYAQSVFTHIPFDTQQAWIEEMARVLRPGGFFVCNITGPRFMDRMLTEDQKRKVLNEGELTLTGEDETASWSTKVIDSWDVFQTREKVVKAFGACFHIRDYVPSGLDVLVLQKPE